MGREGRVSVERERERIEDVRLYNVCVYTVNDYYYYYYYYY